MTSIEWLEGQILNLMSFDTTDFRKQFREKFEQAKEMHKQEILDAYEQGSDDEIVAFDGTRNYKHGVEYYTSTYGSKISDECQFEPTPNTSSATICANCGREKFLHKL